jgi:hypothetical protein
MAQFYATAWRSGNGYESTLNFAIEGHRFELKVTELPTIFAFAGNDFHGAELTSERTIAENELAPLYYPRNEHNFGKNMVCFPSTTSLTTSSTTSSLPSEVTALAPGAQQGTFSLPFLMIKLLHALAYLSGLS